MRSGCAAQWVRQTCSHTMRFRVKLFSILPQKELRSIGCSYKRHANINRFYFTHLKMLLGLFIRKILWSEETCSKYLWIQFLEAIFINNIKGSTVVYLELKSINKLKYFVLLSTNISLCSHLHKKYLKEIYSGLYEVIIQQREAPCQHSKCKPLFTLWFQISRLRETVHLFKHRKG